METKEAVESGVKGYMGRVVDGKGRRAIHHTSHRRHACLANHGFHGGRVKGLPRCLHRWHR